LRAGKALHFSWRDGEGEGEGERERERERERRGQNIGVKGYSGRQEGRSFERA